MALRGLETAFVLSFLSFQGAIFPPIHWCVCLLSVPLARCALCGRQDESGFRALVSIFQVQIYGGREKNSPLPDSMDLK